MIKDAERKIAVCVLGMHRSGTSTIARSLNLLGVYIGEEKDFIQPNPYNPEGFWEIRDLYRLHDRLLATLNHSNIASIYGLEEAEIATMGHPSPAWRVAEGVRVTAGNVAVAEPGQHA